MTLNIHSAKALNSVAGHEITHVLEGTEMYDSLREAVFAYAESKGELGKRRSDLEKLYAHVKGADIDGELTADLVGDYIFTDADFVRQLHAGHRNLFQKIWGEIKHLCKLATAGSKEARQLEKAKKLFEDVYREARAEKSTTQEGGVRYSLVGRTAEGFGIYKTNYPLNTPKSVKQAEIISLVQNVWSNRPIKLTIVENGKYADITAKFNPDLSERSDLAKIVFGNRKGTGPEKRMTLDLGSDLYKIAEESKFTYSKEATPKPDNPAHEGVSKYHYFVTNIVYKDNDGNYIPCHMNIDVKRNGQGDWFYSFALEKGSAPQALLAAGTDESATLPNESISDSDPKVNQKMSLSAEGDIAPVRGRVYGKDIGLDPGMRTLTEALEMMRKKQQQAERRAVRPEVQHEEGQQHGDEDLPWTAESAAWLDEEYRKFASIRDIEPDAATEAAQGQSEAVSQRIKKIIDEKGMRMTYPHLNVHLDQ